MIGVPWLAFVVASHAAGAIAEVQAAGNNSLGSAVTTLTVTLPAVTVSGDTGVVVVVQSNTPGSETVVDNAPAGSSPYALVTSDVSSGNQTVDLWMTAPGGLHAGAGVVTVTINGGPALTDVEYAEYAGVLAIGSALASPDGGAVSATSSIDVTTQDPGNWVVAGFGAHGASTYAAGVGNLRDQQNTQSRPTTTIRASAIVDNNSPTPGIVTNSALLSAAEPWNGVAVELRVVAADGGAGPDGGSRPDAGFRDAGSIDGGTPGTPSDAGSADWRLSFGCGCDATAPAGTLTTWACLAFLRRRRASTWTQRF